MEAKSSQAVLEQLMEGNQRYVAGRLLHPRRTPEHRYALRDRQAPFACVLGCADSRVPPEVIFDQGLGDLFVVRVAGNIVDHVTIGSLEYGVLHLGIPLLIVLGHRGCGAVKAAVEAIETGKEVEGHLRHIVDAIRPAVRAGQVDLEAPGDLLDRVIHAHIRRSIQLLLERGWTFSSMVREHRLRIVGACYDLESGRVEILEDTGDASQRSSCVGGVGSGVRGSP